MLYVVPSNLHTLLMYESMELPFPQRPEEASNSRRVPAGGEGQPLQFNLTLNTRLISPRSYINALT